MPITPPLPIKNLLEKNNSIFFSTRRDDFEIVAATSKFYTIAASRNISYQNSANVFSLPQLFHGKAIKYCSLAQGASA